MHRCGERFLGSRSRRKRNVQFQKKVAWFRNVWPSGNTTWLVKCYSTRFGNNRLARDLINPLMFSQYKSTSRQDECIARSPIVAYESVSRATRTKHPLQTSDCLKRRRPSKSLENPAAKEQAADMDSRFSWKHPKEFTYDTEKTSKLWFQERNALELLTCSHRETCGWTRETWTFFGTGFLSSSA